MIWAVGAYCDRFYGVLHAFRVDRLPGPSDAHKANSLCSKHPFYCAPGYPVDVSDAKLAEFCFRKCATCSKRIPKGLLL